MVSDNLDEFLSSVYTYFTERGFWRGVAIRVTNLLTFLFSIAFSTLLFLVVNWASLFDCPPQRCEILGTLSLCLLLRCVELLVGKPAARGAASAAAAGA